MAAWLRGKVRAADVAIEWRAQLDLLRSRLGGKPIHHLDGHQHLHVVPGLWRVTLALQREYGVALIRRPCEPTRRAWLKDFPMGAGLQALAACRAVRREERFFGVGTSMAFRARAYRRLGAAVLAHPERRYELMVHPGEDARGEREMAELAAWLDHLPRGATLS